MHWLRLPVVLLLLASSARAQTPDAPSLAGVIEQVNRKSVKLFGSGGFRGLAAYGSGLIVSPQGHILTVASPMLDTEDLRVHLHDGRRFHAKVIASEPELDAALVKIEATDLPYFDVAAAAQAPQAKTGDWVLAFSNLYEIATRNEPLSVQRGVVVAYARLQGRLGVFETAYPGEVYFLDAITSNPGAAGGPVTTWKGELIGMIGKELVNTLSDTRINFAMPIQALADFVQKAKAGDYKPIVREKLAPGQGGYHGIVLVPDVVERTPPFIEEVKPDSPAARAGLKPDDLIVYVDGERVNSVKAFQTIVERARPGTAFKLEVRRGMKLMTLELKLDAPPAALKKE
jgi:serine protease Do